MSKLETMAYKMQPAGHESPEAKRKYQRSDKKLEAAFLRFLESWDVDKGCDHPERMITDIDANIPEMHALLLAHQDHEKIAWAGGFVSAIYNKAPDETIIFDLKLATPINSLGKSLRKNKTIINRSTVGDYFGSEAEGTVINEGIVKKDMGREATGPIINLGETDENLGIGSKGPILNYDCAGSIGSTNADREYITHGPILNYGSTGELGALAKSLIINLGDAGERMSISAKKSSVTINYGTAGRSFGVSSRGIVLAVKAPASFGPQTYAKLAWGADDCKCVPALAKYLKNLKELFEKGRKDYRIALEVLESLGPKPQIRIQKEIEQIVKEAGYDIKT